MGMDKHCPFRHNDLYQSNSLAQQPPRDIKVTLKTENVGIGIICN